MNILKAVSNLFSYYPKDIDIENIEDIEDIHIHCNDHKDNQDSKLSKDNIVFNGLQENITVEFENNIENFKTASDIDKFKKIIKKKYKYT